MKRKQINLSDYQYICEFYKNGIDFTDINCQSKFVMLRKFEIYNDVIYDKDIYFIDASLYSKLEHTNNIETDLVVYPIHDGQNMFKFSNLGELYSYYHISSIDHFKYDIKCDSTHDYIKCDKLRIYNPTVKKDLDYIIYIDNFINDIHFHYICNLSNNFKKKYENEFVLGHQRYIEFIEILIPNLDFLFDESNKVYFIENFNEVKTTDSINNYYNQKN